MVGLLLLLPNIQILASEIGGYISEKLIDRSGVSSSSLVIGIDNPQIDVGMGPAVSTLPATNITTGVGSQATLHGNLSSFNGFPPQATIYWEWGYDTSYGNTVGTQVVGATGDYNCNLTGYDQNKTVYYRFVGSAGDGTVYGSGQSFFAEEGRLAGFNLMQTVLLVAIAAVIVVAVFLAAMAGNWIAVLILAMVGIIAFVFVQVTMAGIW